VKKPGLRGPCGKNVASGLEIAGVRALSLHLQLLHLQLRQAASF
jgi:hypothetical protein